MVDSLPSITLRVDARLSRKLVGNDLVAAASGTMVDHESGARPETLPSSGQQKNSCRLVKSASDDPLMNQLVKRFGPICALAVLPVFAPTQLTITTPSP